MTNKLCPSCKNSYDVLYGSFMDDPMGEICNGCMRQRDATCPHNLIHTERLFAEMPKEGVKPPFVIEKICADCGLLLGRVKVHRLLFSVKEGNEIKKP